MDEVKPDEHKADDTKATVAETTAPELAAAPLAAAAAAAEAPAADVSAAEASPAPETTILSPAPAAVAPEVSNAPDAARMEDEPLIEAPHWSAGIREKAAALRAHPMALLAASVVLAAGFGVVAGGLAASDWRKPAPAPAPAAVAKAQPAPEMKAITDSIAQLRSDLAAIKSGTDAVSRNTRTQFAKLDDRFDRIEKAQAEPSGRLSKLSESVERLDQRVQQLASRDAREVTGSVPPRQTQAAAQPAPAPAAVPLPTPAPGPTAAAPAPAEPQVLQGWRVRSVYDGMALLQGRGGMIEVMPGDTLPGAGRIEAIRRQDGRWVVTTSKGMIVSQR